MITVKEAKEFATQLQGAEVEEAKRLEKFIDDEIRKQMTPNICNVCVKVGKVAPRILHHLHNKYTNEGNWYISWQEGGNWLFSTSAPSRTDYRD